MTMVSCWWRLCLRQKQSSLLLSSCKATKAYHGAFLSSAVTLTKRESSALPVSSSSSSSTFVDLPPPRCLPPAVVARHDKSGKSQQQQQQLLNLPTAAVSSLLFLVGGLLATTGTTTSCEASRQNETQKDDDKVLATLATNLQQHQMPTTTTIAKKSNIKTRMTTMGQFALESETPENPSIPTLFLGLSSPQNEPLEAHDLRQLWMDRVAPSPRLARFSQVVDPRANGYFITPVSDLSSRQEKDDLLDGKITSTLHPRIYRQDLGWRIVNWLVKEPIPLDKTLWQIQVSSGPFGQSGAIPTSLTKVSSSSSVDSSPPVQESLIMFRGHHVLADGVSLASAFLELCDEAQELQHEIKMAYQKHLGRRRGRRLTWWQRMLRFLARLAWFVGGSIQVFAYQFIINWTMPKNPLKALTVPSEQNGKDRTVAWCWAAPVSQVKQVAQYFSEKQKEKNNKVVTINDVWVSCVSYAVFKQLEQHAKAHFNRATTNSNGKSTTVAETMDHVYNSLSLQQQQPNLLQREQQEPWKKLIPKNINIVMPVHLGGGILLPHQPIGNYIGAVAAQVPCGSGKLLDVHKTLSWIKQTPAPFLSYGIVKYTSSLFPSFLKAKLFAQSNSKVCVAITNVRGPERPLHIMNGKHRVETSVGFFPLPPGIPIGVCLQSYAGNMSVSITAEKWAVPDANQFCIWMVEEYERLLEEATS